jgi:hypothetical protein
MLNVSSSFKIELDRTAYLNREYQRLDRLRMKPNLGSEPHQIFFLAKSPLYLS